MLRPSRYFDRREPFRVNPYGFLAKDLLFLGVGDRGCPGSLLYKDSFLFANDGTLTAMDPPTDWVWVPELGRWGVDFNGTTQHCPLTTAVTIKTFAAWIKTSSASEQIIVSSLATNSLLFYLNKLNAWYLITADAEGGNDGAWHHVVAVYDAVAANCKLYLDGAAWAASAGGRNRGSTASQISGRTSGGVSSYGFIGTIADVMILNRLLADSEIAALADATNRDLSVGGVPLLVPARKRRYRSTAPLTLTEDTFQNASPFTQDEEIGTVLATGGTAPYSFQILSQTRV